MFLLSGNIKKLCFFTVKAPPEMLDLFQTKGTRFVHDHVCHVRGLRYTPRCKFATLIRGDVSEGEENRPTF